MDDPLAENVKNFLTISSQGNLYGCKISNLILGFHDCVGGCNGCINFNNPDNNGLQLAVNFLTNLYNANGYKSIGVSLADYFALAATVGVTIGLQVSNALRNGGAPCTPQSCPGP